MRWNEKKSRLHALSSSYKTRNFSGCSWEEQKRTSTKQALASEVRFRSLGLFRKACQSGSSVCLGSGRGKMPIFLPSFVLRNSCVALDEISMKFSPKHPPWNISTQRGADLLIAETERALFRWCRFLKAGGCLCCLLHLQQYQSGWQRPCLSFQGCLPHEVCFEGCTREGVADTKSVFLLTFTAPHQIKMMTNVSTYSLYNSVNRCIDHNRCRDRKGFR